MSWHHAPVMERPCLTCSSGTTETPRTPAPRATPDNPERPAVAATVTPPWTLEHTLRGGSGGQGNGFPEGNPAHLQRNGLQPSSGHMFEVWDALTTPEGRTPFGGRFERGERPGVPLPVGERPPSEEKSPSSAPAVTPSVLGVTSFTFICLFIYIFYRETSGGDTG